VGTHHLIATLGTLGVVAIIFAESGIPLGFVLPGKSLLFTAGLLASQGRLNLAVLLVGCVLAAIAGDQVGYLLGQRIGPGLWARPDGRIMRRAHLERAQAYFDRRGPATVVLARFLPVVRTFTPIVAGVARMRLATFIVFNIVGGVLYPACFLLLGYTLGRTIPGIGGYVLPIVTLIAVIFVLPAVVQRVRSVRARRASRPPG
jgi:membrane-associated protein